MYKLYMTNQKCLVLQFSVCSMLLVSTCLPSKDALFQRISTRVTILFRPNPAIQMAFAPGNPVSIKRPTTPFDPAPPFFALAQVPLDTFQDVHVPDQSALLRSKVLPLAVMFFCATFNLTILQNLKDALVITSGGAEMLPFLSTYVVLPMSIAFTAGYAKLCDSVHPARVFYVVVACLLACYLLFLAAFPFHQTLHLHGLSELVSSPALLGLVHCFENWTFSLFFGVSELWGTIVIA